MIDLTGTCSIIMLNHVFFIFQIIPFQRLNISSSIAYKPLLYEPRCEKTVFCICENKDADQLRSGDRGADQRLCFRHKASTIPLLPKYEIPNPEPYSVVVQPGLCLTWAEARRPVSHNEAHFSLGIAFTLPGQLHVIDLTRGTT